MHLFLYTLGLLGLSQAPTFTRLAGLPADVLGFWRLLSAGVIVFILSLFFHKKGEQKIQASSRQWLLLCALFFTAHIWTFAFGALHTKVANLMILFSLHPLTTAVFAGIFFQERVSKRIALAFVLAFVGLARLVSAELDFSDFWTPGNISALSTGVFFSAFMLTGKKARQNTPNLIFSSRMYLICAMMFFLWTMISGHSVLPLSSTQIWGVTGVVLFTTLLGHVVMTYLLNHLNVVWMSCGKLIEPAFSMIAAAVLFGEWPGRETISAYVFIVAALLVLYLPKLPQWKLGSKKSN